MEMGICGMLSRSDSDRVVRRTDSDSNALGDSGEGLSVLLSLIPGQAMIICPLPPHIGRRRKGYAPA